MTTKIARVLDPLKFSKLNWPHVYWSKEQKDVIYSVRDNDETIVPAGNQLGKDFVAAFVGLWFFLSRSPCRVVTTSVDHTQLHGVLWGEIRRFIQTAKHPLGIQAGGPLLINDLLLRKMYHGDICGVSYLLGRVAAKGEGMLGHHCYPNEYDEMYGMGLPHSLIIADEASGIDDETFEKSSTWRQRMLVIGNPYPCRNYFYQSVKGKVGTKDRGGDILRPSGEGYYRKVIKIQASQSPNVRLGLAEMRMDKEPSYEILIPGLKSFQDYQKHRELWDEVRQCICLDAEFYVGDQLMLYPPTWMQKSIDFAETLVGMKRTAKTIGVDPAEGGDSSVWSVCDELGLMAQISMKTPDTDVVPNQTIALMQQWKVTAENVLFDRGGGGKQHADRMRAMGYNVRTIGFGEAPTDTKKYERTQKPKRHRIDVDETRFAYKNRRAEMYGLLRLLIDPKNDTGFAIPSEFTEVHRQLEPIPLRYDGEGRLVLPPKRKEDGKEDQKIETMMDLIGCSPDEADSLVLAVYGLIHTNEPQVLTSF